MIEYVNGNLLDVKEGIICQQVNCRGVMGAGLAKQLKDKYPQIYTEYQEYIYNMMRYQHLTDYAKLKGCVNVVFLQKNLICTNIFGQDAYGRDGIYTDYNALKKGLTYIRDIVQPAYELPVYLPYGIGCGLAGGSWTVVKQIIEDVFNNSDIKCTVVNKEY